MTIVGREEELSLLTDVFESKNRNFLQSMEEGESERRI